MTSVLFTLGRCARVLLSCATLEYAMALDEWCALVRRRFWSERAGALKPYPCADPDPGPDPDPDPDPDPNPN